MDGQIQIKCFSMVRTSRNWLKILGSGQIVASGCKLFWMVGNGQNSRTGDGLGSPRLVVTGLINGQEC